MWNTAKNTGGTYFKSRYIDLIEPKKEMPEVTEEQVISRLKNKLRQ